MEPTAPITPATAVINVLDVRKLVNPAPKMIWVGYRDSGIEFEINFMSKARFKVISDRCSSIKYDSESKKHIPQIDTKKIAGLFVKEAVTNWRGVTPKSLGAILPVNLENLTPEQATSAIPFDADQLAFLVENAFDLDTFIQEVTMNPALFNQNSAVSKEDAAKNSPSSSAGS